MSRAFQLVPFRRPSPPELVLEPLRRGDVAAVTELFEAMSTRSRRQRFLTSVPRLTAKMLAHLSDVDGVGHIAVAARAHGRCVGIARARARRHVDRVVRRGPGAHPLVTAARPLCLKAGVAAGPVPETRVLRGCSQPAALTNWSVKVLLTSIALPLTAGLNVVSTLAAMAGPVGGIRPVGL